MLGDVLGDVLSAVILLGQLGVPAGTKFSLRSNFRINMPPPNSIFCHLLLGTQERECALSYRFASHMSDDKPSR